MIDNRAFAELKDSDMKVEIYGLGITALDSDDANRAYSKYIELGGE